jgi:hypothetical protein
MRNFLHQIILLFSLTPLLFSQTHLPSWQQHVDYAIDAELNTQSNLLLGRERFTYVNRSADTLRVLFLNLYVNAFSKNSLWERYQNERDRYYGGSVISRLNEDLLGYSHVTRIQDGEGIPLPSKVDDTILEIYLNRPILPGAQQTITLEFTEKIPVLIRRMGRYSQEGVDYSMAQWYPKLCVYDQKGWHRNYYLGREFFGEFASFDVSITLPENYVVGASGVLQNASSIGDMMKKNPDSTGNDRVIPEVDSSASGPNRGELSTVISTIVKGAQEEGMIPAKRTWRFHAENIHDFAWCADPNYIYDFVVWQGVRINLLYLPDVAERWKEMKAWTVQILKYLTANVGPYPFRDFTIAQAGDGGMEYPNIVFITGQRGRFSLASVTAHEMAHNWFYGMLANDETSEAWMDEGITSYYTTRLMESMFGRYANLEYGSPFKQKWYPKEDARVNTFVGYESWAKQGFEEKILSASDFFSSDRSYTYSIYYKGEIFMFALQYYFGKARFDELMKKYFSVWNGHHVSTEDMKRFFEKETNTGLDWLFEEWLNTTKQCDYALAGWRGHWNHESRIYKAEIDFKRYGEIEMPLNVTIRLRNDGTLNYRIPARADDPDVEGFTRGAVWNSAVTTYTLYLELPEKIESIALDTSLLMPDVHRLNNRSGWPKLEWHFQKPVAYAPTLDTYVIEHRPSLWYNSVDAARIGYKFKGKWAADEHTISLGIYYGLRHEILDYEFSYATPLYSLGKQTVASWQSARLDGRSENKVSLSRRMFTRTLYRPPINDFSISIRASSLFREDYLPPGLMWEKGRVNTVSLSWSFQPSLYNSAQTTAVLEMSTFGSEWNFSKFSFSYQCPVILKRNVLASRIRVFGGGISGNAPIQEQFYLAGASPRQMFENRFYRSAGTLPDRLWLNQGATHLHYDGEGDLTGYADARLSSRYLAAANLNLLFVNPFRLIVPNLFFITQFEPYLFSDGGITWNQASELNHVKKLIRLDAGTGFRYVLPVPGWWGRYAVKTDFPIWVNRPGINATKKDQWAFRWLIGLDRDF